MLNTFQLISGQTASSAARRLRGAAALVLAAASIAGCSDDRPADAKPGQALASINGHEVTVLQLNEELQRLGVSPQQRQVAGKQVLQALVDRELLESEAAKEKLDRDPRVMQAIERARSLIIAQAYMQKRLGEPVPPSQAEIESYFNSNPLFFANRKQFAMNELIIAASELTPQVRAAADSASSLDEVADFLDAHDIRYGRAQVTRSTADLNAALSRKLLGMPKGQLFVVREGDRAMLIAIAEVRDAPVTLDIAAPQIRNYLLSKKQKELAAAEIQRLRANAKIAYLNKEYAPDPAASAGAAPVSPAMPGPAGAVVPAAAPQATGSDEAAFHRGVAGLK
jgi:peptidyl-prolyl cis-trans isomerase C